MGRRTKKQRGYGIFQSRTAVGRPQLSLLNIIRSDEDDEVKSDHIGVALQQGVNVNEMDEDRITPLIALMLDTNIDGESFAFYEDYIPQLIGNNINHMALEGSALHYSIREIQGEYMVKLIENGANVNLQNGRGETPLFTAAMKLDYTSIRTLIRHGADPNIRDNEGRTPLDIVDVGNGNELETISTIEALCNGGARGPKCQELVRLRGQVHGIDQQRMLEQRLQQELDTIGLMINRLIKVPEVSEGKKVVPQDKLLNSISFEDIKDGDEIVVITEENGSEFFYKLDTISQWFTTRKMGEHLITNPGSGSVIRNQSQVRRWTASVPPVKSSRGKTKKRKNSSASPQRKTRSASPRRKTRSASPRRKPLSASPRWKNRSASPRRTNKSPSPKRSSSG
jgi:ankyrin repeat protein